MATEDALLDAGTERLLSTNAIVRQLGAGTTPVAT
jgi:hypothetical protein